MKPESETETNTPRTDAFVEAIHQGECLPKCDSYSHEEFCPWANDFNCAARFARELETELNQAREDHGRVMEISAETMRKMAHRNYQLETELTQLRAENAELRAKLATCEKLPQ